MGIPLFFKTLSEKYDDTLVETITSNENPNCLFLDMNCLIHPCCRRVLTENYSNSTKDVYEKRMFVEIKNYLDKIIEFCNPSFIYMAIDGVAPCAKMAQQRLRRNKTYLEREEIYSIKDKLNISYNTEFWDTNAISPGTLFMIKLTRRLNEYIKNILNKNILNKNSSKNIKNILLSSHDEAGEGEHKIMDYIRTHDLDNKNILIYGLDADLIMLSLASSRDNVYLLREAIEFGSPQEGRFLYMDIDQLKCNIIMDFKERFYINSESVHTDKILSNEFFVNLIDDYIFICFLLGNDFLPHILSLDIRYSGLDLIMDTYIKTYVGVKTNLITDNKINTHFLKIFLKTFSSNEGQIVKKVFDKRQKLNKHFRIRSKDNEYDKQIEILNNYPILNMEEEYLITNDSLYCQDWKKRYYKVCFDFTEKEEIDSICKNYFDGLVWVFKYYFSGCVSWSWNFEYNHAPTIKDLSDYINNNIEDINTIKFTNDKPVASIVQLITIMPKQSIELIPKKYHKLLTEFKYGLLHYYPEKYKLDTIFKRYYWQCVPILPPIDLQYIKNKVSKIK